MPARLAAAARAKAPAAKTSKTTTRRKKTTTAAKAKPASSFKAASTAKPKVATTTPAAPPAPLTGEKFDRGTVYDASAYLADRLKLQKGGNLRLFHHATAMWPDATPGKKAWMSTKHSGGNYGKGFYTSTRPETVYGSKEFQVQLPVKAFEGKKVYELPTGWYGDQLKMPAGVDIVAIRQGDQSWFVFKPGSDEWLNKSATTADWDKPNEKVGWS
jgi:hypothetical protein